MTTTHPTTPDQGDERRAIIRAAVAAMPAGEPVYLVATGETHEGQETYTRHDVRPPLCDAETLYAAPHPPVSASDFERECDDTDKLLRHLGLDPEQCRTDGGSLNLPRIKALLEQQPASAEPATVEQAISLLKIALRDSKGWMLDYSDAIIRDAIDRKDVSADAGNGVMCAACAGVGKGRFGKQCRFCFGTGKAHKPAELPEPAAWLTEGGGVYLCKGRDSDKPLYLRPSESVAVSGDDWHEPHPPSRTCMCPSCIPSFDERFQALGGEVSERVAKCSAILTLIDNYAPEKVGTAERTNLAVAVDAVLALAGSGGK